MPVGAATVLTFTSTNATAVTISPIGSMATTSGTVTVTPAATTTYTMTATGPGGRATGFFSVVGHAGGRRDGADLHLDERHRGHHQPDRRDGNDQRHGHRDAGSNHDLYDDCDRPG